MRQIKFRAWDTLNKKMLFTGEDLETTDKRGGGGEIFGNLWYNFLQAKKELKEEGLALMQFTGLYDKNGKEIYEGDIIKITGDLSAGIKRISWDEHRGQWNWIDDFKPYQTLLAPFCGMYSGNKVEVIGNIFESPELLK